MNTSNQYTPGPWTPGFDALNNWWNVQDSDARMVVLVKPRGNRLASEVEANAQLIASAPALLTAAMSVIDQIEGIGIEEWAGAEGLYLEALRAAISMALTSTVRAQ